MKCDLKTTFCALALTGLLTAATSLPALAGARRALIVGIGDYAHPNIPDLEAPGHDVALIESLLRAQYGFTAAEMAVLRDRQATRDRFVGALRQLARGGPLDLFLLYVSGHGLAVADDNGDERTDFDDEALLLADADPTAQDLRRYVLRDDELNTYLTAIPAKQVCVILDCCYAGGGAKPLDAEQEAEWGALKTVVGQAQVAGAVKGPHLPVGPILDAESDHILLLAASRPNEPVRELRRVPGGPRTVVSPLTLSLYRRLMRQPALTYIQLAAQVAQDHQTWRLPQQPQLELPRALRGQQFLGGPPQPWPKPFVPILRSDGRQVTLGAGAALGLRLKDRLACYQAGDLKLARPVGTVQITKTDWDRAEAHILSASQPLHPQDRAVITHLAWSQERVQLGADKGFASLGEFLRLLENPNADLTVQIVADRESGRYALGDPISFRAEASQPCCWLVVSIDPDRCVRVLYPNPWQEALEPQQVLEVLPKSADVELVTQAPTGWHTVRAVAAGQPFSFPVPSEMDEFPVIEDEAAFLAALRRFLGGAEETPAEEVIPTAGWGTAQVEVEVAGK